MENILYTHLAAKEEYILKELECRDYQQSIINKTIESFLDDINSIMIVSPAGSGKTIMAFSIANKILELSQKLLNKSPEDIVFGWMAMRRNLLKQAKDENENIQGLQVPNVKYISMFDKAPPKVDVLIEDECHHSAAGSAVNIEDKSNPSIIYGLSATPIRTDRMKLCFSKTITEAGYYNLIQNNYLAQFNQFMIPNWDVKTVTSIFLQDPQKWGKSLMFFLTIKEAGAAAQILKKNGIKVDMVTGKTDRFEQLERFENNEIQVLTNVYVLTEGFNMEDLKTVFVRDSQQGPTIQMAGRVLRKHPDIPVTNIVQSVNTKWPFIRTAPSVHQYVFKKGRWYSVGPNELSNIIYREMIKRLISSTSELPEFLRRKQKQKRLFTRTRINEANEIT